MFFYECKYACMKFVDLYPWWEQVEFFMYVLKKGFMFFYECKYACMKFVDLYPQWEQVGHFVYG